MEITRERWQQAQIAERAAHVHTFEEGRSWYEKIYPRYFSYLGINPDLRLEWIIEIDCADFPALGHCKNLFNCIIIEPMPSEYLDKMIEGKNIALIKAPCEDVVLPKVNEVWLLNVLQHVIDPDKIINQCKEAADVIRFFEPINYPTNEPHPHLFTLDYFKSHFGECVNHYPPNPNEPEFHQWENAYGVWRKNK